MKVLFAMAPDDEIAVSEARAWLKLHQVTADDARLVKRDGMVLVIDNGHTWRRLKPM